MGIALAGNVMDVIIPRGTTIPTKKTKMYSTYQDFQTQINVRIFEGERKLIKDNHELGNFMLEGIPSMRKGGPKIDVTFEIDENSILTVSGKDQATGSGESLTITSDQGRLSQAEIDAMIADAKEHEEADRLIGQRIEARGQFEKYMSNMKNSVPNYNMPEDDKNTIYNAVTDMEDWLNANLEDATIEELEDKLKELQALCDPLVAKMYGGSAQDDDDDIWSEDL